MYCGIAEIITPFPPLAVRRGTVLSDLETVPFNDLGDLCAVDLQGDARFYSSDSFRRLYNDAVKSKAAYKKLLASAEEERDFYVSRCSELEAALCGMTQD